MGKQRLFSVPYNNREPDYYINTVIKPYLANIENVFFAPLFLCRSHQSGLTKDLRFYGNQNFEDLWQQEKYTYEFMEESKGLVKRIITLNAGHYDMPTDAIKAFVVSQIVPLVEKYGIEGFICTDFSMACFIHELYPNIELHTSCNNMQWTVRMMKLWQKEAGISVFNPPREILRTPAKLREMHDAGFKIKALVNEACLYGCPSSVNHLMDLAMNSCQTAFPCQRNDKVNFLKANWVLPRWLPLLDKYVDIYKISGRRLSTKEISFILKSYIELDDSADILSLMVGRTKDGWKEKFGPVPGRFIPDKLLYCECRDCDNGCDVCRKTMELLEKRCRILNI